MVILYGFKEYTPSVVPSGLERAAFTRSENGEDWYETQKRFKEHTLKIVFSSSDYRVLAYDNDPSKLFPPDGAGVAEIEPVDIKAETPYVYDKESNTICLDMEMCNYIEKHKKIANATKVIDKLRDDVLTGLASENEKKRFSSFIKYKKEVELIDVSQSAIEWPVEPD